MSDLQDTLDHVSGRRAHIEARAMGTDSEAERLRLWCAADALRDVEAHIRSEIARKASEGLVYIPARLGMRWSFDPNPEEAEAEGAGDEERERLEVRDGRVYFYAEVEGELLHEEFWIDRPGMGTYPVLYESGDLHDGLGPLSDYYDHFREGVYVSREAFKRGAKLTFSDVLAKACVAAGVDLSVVLDDDQWRIAEEARGGE